MAHFEGVVADRTSTSGSRPTDRSIINGILWRLRCGAPWRDVTPKYGSWNTIYRRFRRWSEAGVWETVAVTLAEVMADSGHYSIDSTTVRAHVSAAGGKGGLIDALLAARGAGSPPGIRGGSKRRKSPQRQFEEDDANRLVEADAGYSARPLRHV
jgi:transposase